MAEIQANAATGSTRKLATLISNLSYSDLPKEVVEAAIKSFQNSLGCIIGGSDHPAVQRVIKAFPGAENLACTCLGQSKSWSCIRQLPGSNDFGDVKGFLTDINRAVLINGIASHVHDYDDTHLHTVVHPAGAIVSCLLGYIEHFKSNTRRIVTGKEFITALVAGIETSLRLGNAVSPNHYSAGWHITGTVSPLGCTAALSNLLKLDAETSVHALGIASTQPVGIRAHFGTDTKALHVGKAAQIGVQAVQLAQAGFTAATESLEGKRGWIEVLGHGADSLDTELDQMEQEINHGSDGPDPRPIWEIEKNTFKPFPCGIVIHPIIDACIQLNQQMSLSESTLRLNSIATVHLKVHPLVLDLTGKKTPQNGLEAKFSVYHGAAIGLVFGAATPAQYEDSIVTSEKVTRVRDKVVAEADDGVRSDEAIVILTRADGSTFVKHVEHAVGSLERPMTKDELKDKFMRQVGAVLGHDRAIELNVLAWVTEDLKDMNLFPELGM